VAAHAIPALVELLRDATLPEARESAAAVLSELARSEKNNRREIADAGGMAPLVAMISGGSAAAVKHATSALWGLAQEPKHRAGLASADGAVERLVSLLKENEGETQGNAAAILVCLANDDEGRAQLTAVGAAGPLMSLALGPASWLRTQAVEALKLMGHHDPSERPGAAAHISATMFKQRAALAANPNVWCARPSHLVSSGGTPHHPI
jgi:hypothetical protein